MRFRAATALSLGARESQEDAVLSDFLGDGSGFAVLADGLGGHAAGAVASELAVSRAHAALAARRAAGSGRFGDVPAALRAAAAEANAAILAHAAVHPETRGMGSTLVIAVLQDGGIHWLSVGDSPLFLFRRGRLTQVNDVHSLAVQLDLLVRVGEMTPEAAAAHPDRHCLTAALGHGEIAKIDCPEAPLALLPGDIVLMASDGLFTLPAPAIAGALCEGSDAGGLAERLIGLVAEAHAPDQDNLSVAVIQPVRAASPVAVLRGLAARGRAMLTPALARPLALRRQGR